MQEYYGNNDYRDYLLHSGRMGMKWYVRNHQDYETKPTRSGKVGKYYGPEVNHNKKKILEDKINIKKTKYAGLFDDTINTVNMSIINKYVIENSPPGHRLVNCTACTMALDLYRRGIPALPSVKMEHGLRYDQISKYYKNPDENCKSTLNQMSMRTVYKRKKEIYKEIISQGDEARGHLLISYKTFDRNIGDCLHVYGGHDILYYVYNGKIKLYDAQKNETYNFNEYFDRVIGKDPLGRQVIRCADSYIRTDNCEPDIDKMIEDGLITLEKKKGGLK